nr:hypothetical protein [uncultured Gellertiella sp.]
MTAMIASRLARLGLQNRYLAASSLCFSLAILVACLPRDMLR